MTIPDFETLAREWLVRVQGHSRPANEEALATELKRVFELGFDLGYADGQREAKTSPE